MLYYNINPKTIQDDDLLANKYKDSKLNKLLNGNGINNIPNLNIITTSSAVEEANKCGNGPLKILKDSIDDYDCQKICATSNASALIVNEGDSFSFSNTGLDPGLYCMLGDRLDCEPQTTYPVMTLNSVTCYPKYPELFGGETGKKIVACNDSLIYDPKNYLYDRLNQKPVYNTNGILMTSEGADEKLSDGLYRFVCKFEGEDERGNLYMENPLSRYHPIKNMCASMIYRAHPNVKTIFNEDGSVTCDCGDYQETRVVNIDPNDKSSKCASERDSIEPVNKELYKMTKTYPCFTLFSPFTDIGKMHPCPPEQFTREGNMFSKLEMNISDDTTALIGHPLYKNLKLGTAFFN